MTNENFKLLYMKQSEKNKIKGKPETGKGNYFLELWQKVDTFIFL